MRHGQSLRLGSKAHGAIEPTGRIGEATVPGVEVLEEPARRTSKARAIVPEARVVSTLWVARGR